MRRRFQIEFVPTGRAADLNRAQRRARQREQRRVERAMAAGRITVTRTKIESEQQP